MRPRRRSPTRRSCTTRRSPGEPLRAAPAEVGLDFDQPVEAVRHAIVVLDGEGALVSGAAREGASSHSVVVPLKHLQTGGYTVRWRVVSSDSHTVSGVFTFGVR